LVRFERLVRDDDDALGRASSSSSSASSSFSLSATILRETTLRADLAGTSVALGAAPLERRVLVGGASDSSSLIALCRLRPANAKKNLKKKTGF